MPFGEQPVRGGKSATVSVAASDTAYKAGADFIADGTCDEVEINQAIAALPALGGLVYLCEGTYNVCGPITIDKDNVTIIGAGASTVIRIRDNHNADINVIEATNFDNILIKDLRIDGNRANQAAGDMNGIYFNTVTYSKIESCWVEDMRISVLAGDGIALYSSSYNIISNNTLSNGSDGAYVNAGSHNTIEGNTCEGSVNDDGIEIRDSNNNTIIGNTCQGNNEDGIYIRGSDNNTVTGNTCQGNGDNGIYIRESDSNTATGNTCQGNGDSGISISISTNNTVAGNTCESNVSAIVVDGSPGNTLTENTCKGSTGYDGINIIDSSNCAVVGNSIIENNRYGIRVIGTSHHNAIVGNNIVNNSLGADNTHDGIYLAGSDYNNIQSNTIRTTVAAPPPNRQRYGINVSNAACDGNLVVCNDLYQSGQTGGYNDAGTNTRGTADGQCLTASVVASTLVVAATDSIDPTRADYQCDGASDETEINAAITALGAIGGTVKLLEGTFTVDGDIVLASNVALVGQGAGTVITIPDGHDVNISIIYGANVGRVLVKDLRVDGNRANQTAGIMRGIVFANGTNSKVEGCWVEDVRSYGIHLTDSSYYNTFIGNTIQGDDVGLDIDVSDYNNFQGNHIRANTNHGVHLVGSENNVLSDNTIQGNDHHGISIDDASNDNTIADNEIINNGLDADVTYDGIIVDINSDHNSIQDNLIRTTTAAPPPNRQRYGINIAAATCDGNLVKDNDLHQSGQTAAFQDLGTGTRLPSFEVPIFDDSDPNGTLGNIGDHVAIVAADGFSFICRFNFRVPDDFHQLVRARVVVVPGGTGDLYWSCGTSSPTCTELHSANADFIAKHAEAVTINIMECLDVNAALDGIAARDLVGVTFTRDSADVLDTVAADVYVLQFYLEYV